MGAKFSAGAYPKGFQNTILKNIDLGYIRGKIYQYERIKKRRLDRNRDLFIYQSEVQLIFNLSQRESHELFQLLDHEQLRRIPSYDLWGALVLAASNSVGEKIEFLFELMDSSRGGYLSVYDIENVYVCVSRGLARLKSIEPPPLKKLKDLAKKSFQAKSTVLNERGEICVIDLKLFISSSDAFRKYFSNLGSNVETKDENKLLQQRGDMLLELLEVESKIKYLENQILTEAEETSLYKKERGGDGGLVRISESQLARLGTQVDRTNDDFDAIRVALLAKPDLKANAAEEQYNRRAQREKQDDIEEDRLKDAVAFSPGRRCKPADAGNTTVDMSEQAFMYRWNKLPQDGDKLSRLDIDIIEDLFEASGVLLTDAEAQLCLDSIPTNQLGRHRAEDVMAWHHDFVLWGSEQKPLFREVAEQASNSLQEFVKAIRESLHLFAVQKKLIESLSASEKKIQKRHKALVQSSHPEHLDGSEDHHLHGGEDGGGRHRVSSPGGGAGGFQLHLNKEPLHGAARLAAWQRQQVLNPPSKVSLKSTFGLFQEFEVFKSQVEGQEAKSPKSSPGKSKSFQKPSVKAKEKKKKYDDKPTTHIWKMNFVFNVSVRPLMDTRASGKCTTFDDNYNLISNVMELDSCSLIDHYTYTEVGLLGELTKSFGSVSWLAISVCPSASDEDAQLLKLCCQNFFESIPWQERRHYYTKVHANLFTVKLDAHEETLKLALALAAAASAGATGDKPVHASSGSPQGKGKHMKVEGLGGLWGHSSAASAADDLLNPQRVVLVALFHEQDMFRQTEDAIAAGIVISRALRDLRVEVNFEQSLPELYRACFPFTHFEDRLFGPQEDELGEDGMNPLRYAKMIRKRQAAAESAIATAADMTFEDLRRHCKVRGLDDRGNKSELVARVKAAFQRQIDIIGFGELSAFGEDMCKKIFKEFYNPNIVNDGGLTLWEMNEMLFGCGSSKSLYSNAEYKALLQEHELQVDKSGRLTPDGLVAYFEKFGRLADSIRRLGFGSLDEHAKGEIKIAAEFDNEAFSSLQSLLSTHTVGESIFKGLVRFLSSLQDLVGEADYAKLSHLFAAFKAVFQSANLLGDSEVGKSTVEWLDSLIEMASSPGWLPSKMHRLLEDLANGDWGLIRSLRSFLMTEFSSFDNWEHNFREHFKAWNKMNAALEAEQNSVDEGAAKEELGDDEDISDEDDLFGTVERTPSNKKVRIEDDNSRNSSSKSPSGQSLSPSPSNSSPIGSAFSPVSKPPVNASAGASLEGSTITASVAESHAVSTAQDSKTSIEIEIEQKVAAMNAEKAAAAALQDEEEAEEARVALKKKEVDRFEQFFRNCLPELVDTKHLTEESFEDLRGRAKRLKGLLADDGVHLNRSEREALKLARDQLESDARKVRADLESCKSLCAAHACAFYDSFRLFGSGVLSCGWGTKELCIRGSSKGVDWASLLPKANGELSVPLQIREDKLRRAAQRKNAALAAMEREQLRRKMDESEKERLTKENTDKKDKRQEEEERLLFAEAFDLYCVAKEERQLLPTLETLATLWERLAQLKVTRYPKSMQAIACQNNFACICMQFFSRSHARWADVNTSLQACSDTLYYFMEDTTLKAIEAEAQAIASAAALKALEDIETVDEEGGESRAVGVTEGDEGSRLVSQPSGNLELPPSSTAIVRQSSNVEDMVSRPDSRSPPATPSTRPASRDSARVSRQSSKLSSKSRVVTSNGERFPKVVIGVPEALLSPIILILQNHLTYLRMLAPIDIDGNPRIEELSYKQKKSFQDNQYLILALFDQLSDAEKDRVLVGVARSVHHIPILTVGNITEQLHLTTEGTRLRMERERKERLELERVREAEAAKKAAEDALNAARQAEEEQGRREAQLKSDLSSLVDGSVLSDLAMSRDEKKKRYERQRELDRIARDRLSKHRTKLYAMIQTNEISDIFQAHAKTVDESKEGIIHWGMSQQEVLKGELFDRPDQGPH